MLEAQIIEKKTTITETTTITTTAATKASTTTAVADAADDAGDTSNDATIATNSSIAWQYRLHVIHRRHRHRGVRQEWLDVELPVYRVLWSEEERRPAQEVIQRARARVGEKGYNLLTKNCKHFAEECIKKTSRAEDEIQEDSVLVDRESVSGESTSWMLTTRL